MKNSASRSGSGSSVETTRNDVRSSSKVRVTASARSTKPSYMVWKRMKKSAMSSKNSTPGTAIGNAVQGLRSSGEKSGSVRRDQPAQQPTAEKSAMRDRTSRKSMALHVGGVSTTIKS